MNQLRVHFNLDKVESIHITVEFWPDATIQLCFPRRNFPTLVHICLTLMKSVHEFWWVQGFHIEFRATAGN